MSDQFLLFAFILHLLLFVFMIVVTIAHGFSMFIIDRDLRKKGKCIGLGGRIIDLKGVSYE